ncbi:MAG: pyridoxal-phosphate dependent enzyme, partial [Gemmatimonadaceae bacterium]
MRALFDRIASLRGAIPLAAIEVRETPVERWRVGGASLLIKRDDLSADVLGGNKARALQLLLAGVTLGDTLLTVGATGSTHALAVARHGAALGAACEVVTWPQELNDVARVTAAALAREARVTHARSVADAYVRAALRRATRRVRWIAAGGSVPLGALGHVGAALELIEQLRRDGIALPSTIVVPLGSG